MTGKVFINLNKIYNVKRIIKKGDKYNVIINSLDGIFHIDHFKLAEGDDIQGANIYPIHSTVECINIEPIFWEINNYGIYVHLNKLKLGEKYEVIDYIITEYGSYVKVEKINFEGDDFRSVYLHSKHFKKC